jgi:hypothetical protein
LNRIKRFERRPKIIGLRQKPTPPSLSGNVLLKGHVYHMVVYVKKEPLERGNYENDGVV